MCFRSFFSALWTATWLLVQAFGLLVLASADAMGIGQALLRANGRLVGQCLYSGVWLVLLVAILAYHTRVAHDEHAGYWRRWLWLLFGVSTLGVAIASFGSDVKMGRFTAAVLVRISLVLLLNWFIRRRCAPPIDDAADGKVVGGGGGGIVDDKPVAKKRYHVFLEGNICAGKSTLCARLVEHGDWLHVGEPLHTSLFEQFNKKQIEHDNYQRSLVSFAFQMVMHERRKHAVQMALLHSRRHKWVAIDRSLIGDYAFALSNYINGSLEPFQFELYHDKKAHDPVAIVEPELTSYADEAGIVPKLVFLVQTAKQCQDRLRERVGADSALPLDYLVGVSIAHYMCMVRLVRYNNEAKKKLLDVFVTDQPPWTASSHRDCAKFCARIERTRRMPCALKLTEPGEMLLRNGSEQQKRYEQACADMQLPCLMRDDDKGNGYACEQAWHDELMRALAKDK